MFKEYEKIYIQKEQQMGKFEFSYTIYSDKVAIGKVQQQVNPAQKITQRFTIMLGIFLSRFNRYYLENMEFSVLDNEENNLGTIEKECGMYKGLILRLENGELFGRVQSTIKLNSPALTVIDPDGNEWIKAKGRYGATNFTVTDARTDKEISSITKRSLVYESVKDNITKNEVYHIDKRDLSNNETLALIGMAIALDIYFHQ